MDIYCCKQYLNLLNVNELHDNDSCASWNVQVAKCKTVIFSLHQQIGDPAVLPHTNII